MRSRVLVVGLCLLASRAHAEPQSLKGAYSEYETVALDDAERLLDARVDAAPEGKIIERIDFVRIDPIETNISGLHQEARARFVLEPEALTFGATYAIPRLEGRWLALTADANAVVGRETGSVEGGYGSVSAERPLFASRTEWAWSTT